jgi:putative DNA primase/helicase
MRWEVSMSRTSEQILQNAGGSTERLFHITADREKLGYTVDPPRRGSEVNLVTDRPPAFSDDSLALRFSEKYQGHLRFVAAWNRWYQWTGSVWEADTTMQSFDRIRSVCRQAAVECDERRAASNIASATTVAAVERLAKADRRHAATTEQWDLDPWLLNTPGGTVDLRTGRMTAQRAEDYMTKLTAVVPEGECPRWLSFLTKITNGDVHLQAFLQRVAGYCLTGSTKEQALFFGHGTGGNGKGAFLNTLSAILGGYATTASMETFTASSSDRHPTDLAMMRGARLVTAQETEQGRRWAESRIKNLTGGDPISARFMRQDFFTFLPSFKLFIMGNYKPELSNVDDAMRRRFNLIHFAVKIPKEHQDTTLPDKLKAEWPGILSWMIQGCLNWQREGLDAPAAVTSATKEYLESEDAMGLWLLERCVVGRSHEASSSALFKSWSIWAELAKEPVGSQKRFSQALISRGFKPKKYGDGRSGFLGITLATPQRSADAEGI